MKRPNSSLKPSASFGTTQWSLVLRAGGSPTSDSRQALGELIQAYWYPLYAVARRRGNSHHDAMDLTQGFFTHIVGSNALESVKPEYGRFRAFIIASFKNFMSKQHRASEALRRGGGVSIVSLTATDFETRYGREPVDDVTPELLFERTWVESLLQRVESQLAQEYSRAGKSELFNRLEPHLTQRGESESHGKIGQRLQLSPAAVAMSLHRMRRRYGELLREEVASTVNDPAEVDDELRLLMAIVAESA